MFYVVLRYRNGSKFGTFNFDTYDEALKYVENIDVCFTVTIWKNSDPKNPVWERN